MAPEEQNTEGKLIIFSAPSGSGKTTIVKRLLAMDPRLVFSVSACTRQKRPDERDGVDYYFLSPEEFERSIKQDDFVEYEEVYKGYYYGTLKSELERIWNQGKHVIFDIDTVGGMNIKKIYGPRALSIFVKTPSKEELLQRLKTRSTETAEQLKERTDKALKELTYEKHFDEVLVNDNLEIAVNEVYQIIQEFIKSK